ncbi:site-specific integrase [Viridibacterium curvum]|uniref:Site-specific integrase n=1 Tax=Viridibacterium curvum TaxID=1101404 RepID=A0ABP9R8D9_9RHOO
MGSVRKLAETQKLFLDFRWQGRRCREYTSLDDTLANRKRLEKVLERIEADIKLGAFDYAKYFPGSRMLVKLGGAELEADRMKAGILMPADPNVQPAARQFSSQNSAMAGREVLMAATPTFAVFTEDWRAENAVLWRRTYQQTIKDIVMKHLQPAFREKSVGSISREEILKFRSELAKVKGRKRETLSPRRINAIMNVLGLILKEASDRYKFTCPYYNIKPLKIPKSDVQPFSLDEVRLILQTVREDYRDYFTVRFFTGMRTGEIDGLRWEYVDFSRRLILVRESIVQGVVEENTKTIESNRDILMSQIVFDALQRQRLRTGRTRYVFCTRDGTPLDHNNVTKRVWYPLLRHLGLKERRPYQTRHTAATLWLAAGENPEWIARQMGHTSTEMLFKVYSRYVPNLTRRDGSAFERLMAGGLASNDAVTQTSQEAIHG